MPQSVASTTPGGPARPCSFRLPQILTEDLFGVAPNGLQSQRLTGFLSAGFESCFTRILQPREGCPERFDAQGWRGDAALTPQSLL